MGFQKFGSPEDVLVLSDADDDIGEDDDVDVKEDEERDAAVQE